MSALKSAHPVRILLWLFLLGTLVAVLGTATAGRAQAEPAHDHLPTPIKVDDGGLQPPTDHEVSAFAGLLGMQPTVGPGKYDVVVAGLTMSTGATPASGSNSPAVVSAANDQWQEAAFGAYTLSYRSFVSASLPGTTCDLQTMDAAVDSAVSTATGGGVPRSGSVGIIVAIVIPEGSGCGPGQGWIGLNSFYVTGYWPGATGAEILAHEVGHNFGIGGHAGAMTCSPDQPAYPTLQTPTWPCTASASTEYNDLTSIMGASGIDLSPKRIAVSQLREINVIPDSQIVTAPVSALPQQYTLIPVSSSADGTKSLKLAMTGSTSPVAASVMALEYHLQTPTNGGARVYVEGVSGASPNAQTWVYRGNAQPPSPDVQLGRYAMPPGSSIRLADGRTVTIGTATVDSVDITITGTATTPGAPTGVVATPGNGSASVAFTTPSSDGGSAITNYQYSTNGGSTWVTRAPAATTSPISITGLTNGTTYQVVLRAVNAVGAGTASAAVSVTPRTTPGAPTIDYVTPGNTQVQVNFSAPVSTGGSALTNYQYSLNGGSTWVTRAPAATTSPLTITGLTNGTTYNLVLRAVNAVGAGASSAVVEVTPEQVDGSVFVPIAPTRAYDSRDAGPNSGPMVGAQNRVVPLTAANLPLGTTAVAYNITVTDTQGAGFLSVTPSNAATFEASSINWDSSGVTLANGYVVGLAPGTSNVRVFSGGAGQSQFIIDIVGYYQPLDVQESGVYVPIDPQRAYDSRSTEQGALATGATARNIDIPTAIIPTGAVGMTYNLTVTDTAGAGFLAVTPKDGSTSSSTINWSGSGQTWANGTQVALKDGGVSVRAGGGGSTQFIVDVTGYFIDPATAGVNGTRFHAITPERAYDSRILAQAQGQPGRLTNNQSRTTSMQTPSVSPTARAVAYNLTQVDTLGSGFLRVAPAGANSNVSTINWFRTGQITANGTAVGVGTGVNANRVTTTAGGGGSTEYILDVAGYYE